MRGLRQTDVANHYLSQRIVCTGHNLGPVLRVHQLITSHLLLSGCNTTTHRCDAPDLLAWHVLQQQSNKPPRFTRDKSNVISSHQKRAPFNTPQWGCTPWEGCSSPHAPAAWAWREGCRTSPQLSWRSRPQSCHHHPTKGTPGGSGQGEGCEWCVKPIGVLGYKAGMK